MTKRMSLLEQAHALHRAWRYRLRSERDELKFLRARNLRGGTVVDVGANRGIYSYWMHKSVEPHGNVIAFEPQPELCHYIERLKAAFCLDRLTVVNAGLSSAKQSAELVRPRSNWGGASLHLEPSDDMEILKIQLTTLDDYFCESSLRPVRFIKCDAQNHETRIFEGGERLLGEDQPDLLFEFLDDKVDEGRLFPFLQRLGYSGFFFFEGKLVSISDLKSTRSKISKPYLNFVFTSRNSNRMVA